MPRKGFGRRSLLLAVFGALALTAAPGAAVAHADGGTPLDTLQCAGTLPADDQPPGSPFVIDGALTCTITEADGAAPFVGAVPVQIAGVFGAGTCGSGVLTGLIEIGGPEFYEVAFQALVVGTAGPLVVTGGFDPDGSGAATGAGAIDELESCCPLPVTCSLSVGGVPAAIAFTAEFVEV